MSEAAVLTIVKETVWKIIVLSAPFLVVSIALGLIISVFQAATQIHEQTITFVPKLIAVLILMLLLGSWMINSMTDFFHMLTNMMLEL